MLAITKVVKLGRVGIKMWLKQSVKLGVNGLKLSRTYSTQVQSYFKLFPKNFPGGGPPPDSFIVNERTLRREYKGLQSESHPDKLIGSVNLSDAINKEQSGDLSTLINRAYGCLKNPYTRVCHVIKLHHPDHLDVTKDEVAKDLIAQFQANSSEVSFKYKDMLMTVLEAHEALELANLEEDLEELLAENEARIDESEEKINDILHNQWPLESWDELIMQAIQLKYWVNIENALKDWEPGKPVHLTH